uniref:uncharacterized protein LOC120338862 n=1 Tax=Styela clava TaxID=7725 RepID=UPI001939FB68|nr:uncharacterized protein LOC120338862 [Styela clava]
MEKNFEGLNIITKEQAFGKQTQKPTELMKTNQLEYGNKISASDLIEKPTTRRSRSVDTGRRMASLLEPHRSRSVCSMGNRLEIELCNSGDGNFLCLPNIAKTNNEGRISTDSGSAPSNPVVTSFSTFAAKSSAPIYSPPPTRKPSNPKSAKGKWKRRHHRVHPTADISVSAPPTDGPTRGDKKSSKINRFFKFSLAKWGMMALKPLTVMSSPLMTFM